MCVCVCVCVCVWRDVYIGMHHMFLTRNCTMYVSPIKRASWLLVCNYFIRPHTHTHTHTYAHIHTHTHTHSLTQLSQPVDFYCTLPRPKLDSVLAVLLSSFPRSPAKGAGHVGTVHPGASRGGRRAFSEDGPVVESPIAP